MNVIAKQINPEIQESPLFYPDCFPDNIVIFGNSDYNNHTCEVFNKVYNMLDGGDLYAILNNVDTMKKEGYKNTTQAINDFLPPINKKYSTKTINKIKDLVLFYGDYKTKHYKDNNGICQILAAMTGKVWDTKTIRGNTQGEQRQICYIVDEWSPQSLKVFECEYFNSGTEWEIFTNIEHLPDSKEAFDFDSYSIYCTSWDANGIKKEIAEATGCEIENIKLYQFDGYTKIPKYKEYE